MKSVVISGLDGTGKDTQIDWLKKEFGHLRQRVVTVWDSLDHLYPDLDKSEGRKRLGIFLTTLSTEARSLLLLSAWTQAFHQALKDNSVDVLWVNGFVYKYWAAEKVHGCPDGLWSEAIRFLPRPDLVLNLDLPAAMAADRKSAFSPFECGFAEPRTSETFCNFQEQCRPHLQTILEQTVGNLIQIDATPDAKSVAQILSAKIKALL